MVELIVIVLNDRQDPHHHEHGHYMKHIKDLGGFLTSVFVFRHDWDSTLE